MENIKKFLEEFYKNTDKMCFNDFRKAFTLDFQDKIKEYPLFNVEISDAGYEAGDGLGLLYGVFNSLAFDLESDEIEIIKENLYFIFDYFWSEISKKYKLKN